MNRPMLQAVLFLSLCPLLGSQQVSEPDAISSARLVTPTGKQSRDPNPVSIPADTSVELRLEQNISSADAHEGEGVRFTLKSDLAVEGRVVAPAGTACFAAITAVRPRTTDHFGEVKFSDPELDLGPTQRIRFTTNECLAVPGACAAVGVVGAVTLGPFLVIELPVVAVMRTVDRFKQIDADRRIVAAGGSIPVRTRNRMKGNPSREEYSQGQSFEYYTLHGVRIHLDRIAVPLAAGGQTQR